MGPGGQVPSASTLPRAGPREKASFGPNCSESLAPVGRATLFRGDSDETEREEDASDYQTASGDDDAAQAGVTG